MEDYQRFFPFDPKSVMFVGTLIAALIVAFIWAKLAVSQDGDSVRSRFLRDAQLIAALAIGSAVGAALLGYALLSFIRG
jgi:hypothetical protein